jgi:phosphohistidine phosphatase
MSTSKNQPQPDASPADEESGEPQERGRFIVLLRHGVAEERSENQRDEDRSLTAEGHARMKQIARGLERAFPKANAIYSSPLLRATQTAMWVAKSYRSRITIANSEALAPGASKDQFLALVSTIRDKRFIVVGHEPSLSENLSALLGTTTAIELKKGGCYGVRLDEDGTATLEWLLPPRLLRKLAE